MGLAVADAMGAQIEGGASGTPSMEMVGGGFHDCPPGGWTDDTAMALCLAESLVEKHGCDLRDQIDRYLMWRERGHLSWAKYCLGIGQTTMDAIADYKKTGRVTREQDARRHAGNGSIMRLAPVALAFRNHPLMWDACGASSRTTHDVPEAIDGCRLLGHVIHQALEGRGIPEAFASLSSLPMLAGGIEEIKQYSWRKRNFGTLRNTSYVVATLESAFWILENDGGSFRRGIQLVLALGGDADTIGAVYGQMSGAFRGDASIPECWIEALKMLPTIVGFADELLELSENNAELKIKAI